MEQHSVPQLCMYCLSSMTLKSQAGDIDVCKHAALQYGIELSSADVNLSTAHAKPNEGGAKAKGKKVLQRQTTDEFMAADNALDIDDVQQPAYGNGKGLQAQSPEERRKQFEGQGWSDVALRDK